jgi:hypothetical protein
MLQRLPDEFAMLLDGHEPREVTLQEAGDDLERGWEQFTRAHGMVFGNVMVFSCDGDAVLTVKVFDHASTCFFLLYSAFVSRRLVVTC